MASQSCGPMRKTAPIRVEASRLLRTFNRFMLLPRPAPLRALLLRGLIPWAPRLPHLALRRIPVAASHMAASRWLGCEG